MRWSEIDVDYWRVIEKEKERLIYLSPLAKEQLRNLPRTSEFVFPSPKTGHIRYLGKASKRISEELQFSPMELRRSSEFALLRLGTRPDVLDRIMGRALKTSSNYDYTTEIKSALTKWSKNFTTKPPQNPFTDSKVVPLFG